MYVVLRSIFGPNVGVQPLSSSKAPIIHRLRLRFIVALFLRLIHTEHHLQPQSDPLDRSGHNTLRANCHLYRPQ